MTKTEFCKSLTWGLNFRWFDFTGLYEFPGNDPKIAKVELVSQGTVGHYTGFRLTIINKNNGGQVDIKSFLFDDHLDIKTNRSDSREDYQYGFYVANNNGWNWYIAQPKDTRPLTAAIEEYMGFYHE